MTAGATRWAVWSWMDLDSVDCNCAECKRCECTMENGSGGVCKKILLSHKCNIALLNIASIFSFSFTS